MTTQSTARFLIRHWGRLLILMGALAGFSAWRSLNLEFDFSFSHLFLNAREDAVADDMSRRFGDGAGAYLAAVLEGPDVFTHTAMAAIAEMSDAVASIPYIAQVFSFATVPYIRGDGRDLSLDPLAAVMERESDVARLRSDVLASPLFVRRLASPDGRTTVVLALLDATHRSIRAREPTIAAFRSAVESRLPAGFTVRFTGYPVTEAEYGRLVLEGFAVAQVAGLTLMAAALYLMFRSFSAVTLPLLTVGLATLIVMGMIELTGQRLTFTNASVPLMMLVIGVAEVSFYVSRFYEESAQGWDEDVPVRAVASALWPGFIAACTTAAGFLALGTGHIGLTRDFGFNMAVASIVTFSAAAVVIPGALARLGRPAERSLRAIRGGPITRLLERIAAAVSVHSTLVFVATVALVGAACGAAFRITTDQFATRELADDHPIEQAQRLVDRTLSGAFQTNVLLRAQEGETLLTPEGLKAIEALEAFLARDPNVVKAWSIVDYVKELEVALRGAPHTDRRIPESAALIAQYLLLLSSGGSASDVSTLIDPSRRYATIVLGTSDLGTDTLRDLHRRAAEFVRDEIHDVFEMRFAGDYWEIARGNETLTRDQLWMTITSYLLIFPLVGLFLRSWKLTLLCLPPNVAPLVAALGFMGLSGIPLRVSTSIILPVSLGVAVDTTTHYISRAREEWQLDGDYPGAVRRALIGTGWGMVSSTVALVVGFCAYQIPSFQSFQHVGILASFTMVVALAANLFLTPALVVWTRPFGRWGPRAVTGGAGDGAPLEQAS